MHGLVAAEPLEHAREERVSMPVVERDVRRRSHDREHLRRVDAVEHRGIGLEVGEVVLLLDPRVADELRRFAPSRASRSAGIASGKTTRVAARKPSWCWSVANS